MADDKDFLLLDKPKKDHYLFQDEVQKTIIRESLKSVLETSTKIPDKLRKSFLEFMVSYTGSQERFCIELRKKEEFRGNEKTIEELQFMCDLGMLTLYHVPLIRELQRLREIKREDDNKHTIKKIQSSSDLALLDIEFWRRLINKKDNGNKIGIPDGFWAKGSVKEREEDYLTSITDTIDRAYPTVAFYRELSKDTTATNDKDNKKINWKLLRMFLRKNPDFNPTNPAYDNTVNWDGIDGANERKLVKASMNVLREEVKMYPSYDYRKDFVNRNGRGFNNTVKEDILKFLEYSISSDFDLLETNIDDYLKNNDSNLPKNKDKLIENIKGYQRILKITPHYKSMKSLAINGFDSAFKISITPRNYFLKQIRDIPGGIEKAKEIRVNAVAYNLKTTSQRKCIHGALPT